MASARDNKSSAPPGLARFPLFYPQLALWAAFLRRFAAETGNFVQLRNTKSSPVPTKSSSILRQSLAGWPLAPDALTASDSCSAGSHRVTFEMLRLLVWLSSNFMQNSRRRNLLPFPPVILM